MQADPQKLEMLLMLEWVHCGPWQPTCMKNEKILIDFNINI